MNAVRQTQDQEFRQVEIAQKSQFEEFSKAWDSYMTDYEATAYMSLEKLKEKHMLEFQAFHEKVVREAKMKTKFSKELLELRKREQMLVKQKLYEEAERTKRRADQLEEWEKARNDAIVQQIVDKKEQKLRKQQ